MIAEYTVLTVIGIIAVVIFELAWARTGIFRSVRYWIALGIMFFFQIWVDGWLTKLSNPVVLYNPQHHSGIRFPWDIPIEDFGFGFAMLTLTLIIWLRLGRRGRT